MQDPGAAAVVRLDADTTGPLPSGRQALGTPPASGSGDTDPEGDSDRAPGHLAITATLWALRAGPVCILALLVLVLSLLSDVFLSFGNAGNIMKQSAVICVLALGQLLVILTRGIDLSVGSVLSLTGVVGALVWKQTHSSGLSILATLCVGLAVGTLNGILLVKARLPHPFISTLATLSAASGLALFISHSETIQGVPPIVATVGSGRLSWIPGAGGFGWFPVAALVVIGVALVTVLVTRGMVWGRWVYAVGGDPEAARRTGIPVGAVLISVYVVSGLAAAIAALLTWGRGYAASPTAGTLAELDAIAAVIIGGASFLGGRGTVLNAITGSLIIAVLRNGLNLLSIDPNWQYIATGAVIVVAVELDVVRARLESRFRSLHAMGTA